MQKFSIYQLQCDEHHSGQMDLSIYQLQCDEHHSGQMDLLVYFIAQSIVKVDRGPWSFGNKFYQQGGGACSKDLFNNK